MCAGAEMAMWGVATSQLAAVCVLKIVLFVMQQHGSFVDARMQCLPVQGATAT
jgi:hypothetical protein